MSIEELLSDKNGKRPQTRRPKKRAAKTKPRFGPVVIHQNKLTFGDWINMIAKLAAASTFATVIANCLPAILVAISGGYLLLKGCHVPAPIPLQRTDATATAAPYLESSLKTSSQIDPASSRESNASVAALLRGTNSDAPEPTIANPRSASSNLFQDPFDIDVVAESKVDAMEPDDELSGLGQAVNIPGPSFASPALTSLPNFDQPTFRTFDSHSRENLEAASLFNARAGRTYMGTCQMPGQSSRRMSLTLSEIRDNGTSINARLSLLDSRRKSKKYSGTVASDPPRLILRPESEGQGFGTFLTYMPWYSDSPTPITLDISKDGLRLYGESASSEQFELVAQPERTRIDVESVSEEVEDEMAFEGFDALDGQATTWHVHKVDSRTLSAGHETWEFTSLATGVGSFVWMRGSSLVASGTYREDTEAAHIDIILTSGKQQKIFYGLVRAAEDDRTLHACIPKEPGEPRPISVSSQFGRVYTLQLAK